MTAALSRPGAHIPNQEKRLGDAPADSVQRGVPLPPPAPLPAPGGAARRVTRRCISAAAAAWQGSGLLPPCGGTLSLDQILEREQFH